MLNDLLIPASRTALTEQDNIPTRVWFVFFQNVYRYIQKGFGSFYDTTNQTITANTPKVVGIGSIGSFRSVVLDPLTSKISVSRNGIYNVQFSIQLTNPSTSTVDDVAVWVKVNGVDVANSNSWGSVPTSHGGVDGEALIALNVFVDLVPTDYIQLYWLSKTGNSQIKTIAASTSPAYPASPSVILTVDQVV